MGCNAGVKGSVVLATGGSGGHVFPALAFAETCVKKGWDVAVWTDERGKRFLQEVPHETLAIPALSEGKGAFILAFFRAFFTCFARFRKDRPAYVLGFGGATTLPVLLAAWALRVPRAVHQSDAVLGRANLFLAFFVQKIAVGWPETQVPWINKRKKVVTGTPVRASVWACRNAPFSQGPFRILVLGGSQGTSLWDRVVPSALALLSRDLPYSVLMQSKHAYSNIETVPFVENVAEEMVKAHLVLTRAGALSLTELETVARPMLIVPIARSARNHQQRNAARMAKHGAAVLHVSDLTPETLALFLSDAIVHFQKSLWCKPSCNAVFPASDRLFQEILENEPTD